jgi:tRNA(Ile)-lysidine synthase
VTPPPDLAARFAERLRALGITPDAHVLVAVSGGMDSVVLLHLFRFTPGAPRVTAAHFDHAMRAGSAADAAWVRGLCAAWGVPLVEGRAEGDLRTEDEARRARYRFLRGAGRGAGATHLATAHHADDQAETVLFRALRGTGIAGLAGIPERDGWRVRPLLPFWRAELRRYARGHGVRWRRDPTNHRPGPARNHVRHDLLPRIERTLAPAARRSLVRLAAAARAAEAEWEEAVRRAEADAVRWDAEGAALVPERLAVYDWPVAARVLRRVLRHAGVVPGRAGTRSALQFIIRARSGRVFRLPGGTHRLRAEPGAVRVEAVPGPPGRDEAVVVEGAAGEAALRLAGREMRARWRTGEPGPDGPLAVSLDAAALRLPLALRAWRPGDRMRTRGGTKKLKKLFLEARVPAHRRGAVPVLEDAQGRVLWAAGVARADLAPPVPGAAAITITITDA